MTSVVTEGGVVAHCKLDAHKTADAPASASKTDVSALSAMLAQKWKTGGTEASPDALRAGQVRSFRITSVDPAQKRIELELAWNRPVTFRSRSRPNKWCTRGAEPLVRKVLT
jgi:hypothetical protein